MTTSNTSTASTASASAEVAYLDTGSVLELVPESGRNELRSEIGAALNNSRTAAAATNASWALLARDRYTACALVEALNAELSAATAEVVAPTVSGMSKVELKAIRAANKAKKAANAGSESIVQQARNDAKQFNRQRKAVEQSQFDSEVILATADITDAEKIAEAVREVAHKVETLKISIKGNRARIVADTLATAFAAQVEADVAKAAEAAAEQAEQTAAVRAEVEADVKVEMELAREQIKKLTEELAVANKRITALMASGTDAAPVGKRAPAKAAAPKGKRAPAKAAQSAKSAAA